MTLINTASSSDWPEQRLLTVADLDVLPTDLPSGPVKYELDRGRLVVMSPPVRRHGRTQIRIGTEFVSQGEKLGLGEAGTETAFILSRDPDTVRVPDVFFIAKRSFPIRESREGYLETPPDIVVEVRSKNDRQVEIDEKIGEYLNAGVLEVWVVDPSRKTITTYRVLTSARILTEQDTLTVPDIIPGFSLSLVGLFRE